MKAAIIMPTFNALKYTKLCIDSIRLTTRFPYEIIIVDNGSTDGTREWVELQKDIKLIKTKTNLGYAGACNVGMPTPLPEYIVFSNNDIIFTPNWLSHLINTAEAHKNIGIVGPVTNKAAAYHVQSHRSYNNDLELFKESKRIYLENKGRALIVPALVFFCTLVKRKTIEVIGFLDPSLGLGGCDDFDYSLRINRFGLTCVLDLSVFVHHFCSRTFSLNDLDYKKLSLESIDKFNKKWKGISHLGVKLNT